MAADNSLAARGIYDGALEALKVPPHSIEAEQAVLGGLLLDNEAWPHVIERIKAEDFYRRDHANVFRAIEKLAGEREIAEFTARIPHPYPKGAAESFVLAARKANCDGAALHLALALKQRPGVAIVGPKLLYPDDTIQHAGVILGPFGGSVHVFKRLPGHNPGFLDLPDAVRNFSAVTFACALIDRKVYEEIGGMDATLFPVAFNDTDFCLRAREAGYDVVYTPHACLYHHESVTKTVIAHPDEIMHLRERWGHVIDHDPFYNPNLTRTGEDARLNMDVPRVS